MSGAFVVLPDPNEVAEAAVAGFVDASAAAIAQRGRFYVAVSGGRTPRAAFELLAQPRHRLGVEWDRVEIFWIDERAVPPDHPASNFGVCRTALLDHLPNLRPEQIHRMPADGQDLDVAASAYEAELRRVVPAGPDEIPVFDLVWLGMGADGHTASLCPNDPSLAVTDRLVVPTWPAGYDTARLTLTYPILNAAREVLFQVTGAQKAATLAAVRGGADLPAGRIRGPSITWLVDAAAGGGAVAA